MSSRKYNLDLKEKVVKLRISGKSYGEIRKILNISSKGTISHWLSGLVLDKKTQLLLHKNSELAHKRGLFKANKEREQRVLLENSEYFTYGKNQIKSINKYALTILGASLYWAEGTKAEPKVGLHRRLVFTNSDPLMISVFMKFLREVMLVPEEKITAGMHLYASMDREKTREFWSNVTNLPKDKFYIVEQVSRASKGKRTINFLPFGTFVIRINSRKYFYIIKGMISGLINNKMLN